MMPGFGCWELWESEITSLPGCGSPLLCSPAPSVFAITMKFSAEKVYNLSKDEVENSPAVV